MLCIGTTEAADRERGLSAAATALRRGQLVAIPLETSYGIAADAFNANGVEALRRAKHHTAVSVQVLVPRVATVSGIARVSPIAQALMANFWPGPLTLVLPVQPTLDWTVSSGEQRVAVRQPLHPVALELLARTGPLGVLSAGEGGSARDPGQMGAEPVTEHIAVFLDAGKLPGGSPSAVIDVTTPEPRLLRLGPLALTDLLSVCPELVHDEGRDSR